MGGKPAQQPQFIQPPPPQIIQSPTPPPNVAETSAQLAQNQLQYNPQLTQQAVQLQQQYAPQLAQSEYDVQAQYGPLYRQLYQNLFPSQVQGQETLAQQATQRLQSPQSLTSEQLAAQTAIRDRSRTDLQRGIRSAYNLGGNLYSGAREKAETDALSQYEQGLVSQDIGFQQQSRDQALRELIASSQVVFPQVQQPAAAQFGQGVTPSPDSLMQAILASQSNFLVNPSVYQPGNTGTPGFFGSASNAFAGRPIY